MSPETTSLSLEAEGLTACSNALSGVAGDLTKSAATVAGAESSLAAEIFGVAGGPFIGVCKALVTQHASDITDLAATVTSMSHAAAASAAAYRDTDQANADAVAKVQWSGQAPATDAAAAVGTPLRHAAASFDHGYHQTAAPLDWQQRDYPDYRGGFTTPAGAFNSSDLLHSGRAPVVEATAARVQLPGRLGAVQAPNPRAATAVRAALSQLGVPYQWGGSAPGAALDCSGLTQYAYRQAGVPLNHFAADQRVGRFLGMDPSAALPGDLAVWDQHVAMVIGDGQMVEAGNPVQITPIRTSNVAGGHADTFYGFYRPTESG